MNTLNLYIMPKLTLVVPAILLIAACNNTPSATENTNTDTTPTTAKVVSGDTTTQPEYDPAMDGIVVGAKFIKKLADTLNVKMYEITLKPGDSAALHSHPDHTVYALQGGKLAVYFGGTKRVEMDLPTGTGFVSGPVLDAGKNIGKTTIKLLVADMYRPRGNKNINAK